MSRFNPYLICFFLSRILGWSNILGQDPESINPMTGWVDARHYNLELWFNPPSPDIKGKLTLSLKILKSINQLNLNLEHLNLDTLYCLSTRLNYSYDGNSIRIEFEKKISKNTQLDIIIHYHGSPSDGLIIRNLSGQFTVFADNWANRARNWFPGIDHPSDKASFQSTVHLPMEYQVIGNGQKTSDTLNGGERTVVHRIDQPIPTYCMVIGLSRFSITMNKTAGGVPILYYTYPGDSSIAMDNFQRVPDMVYFFDSLVGPYAYPQLALVQSSTKFGGMENSSAIFLMDKGSVFTGKSDPEELLAHEIAHQWFGDAVTESSWSELWLSEGFATYFSALYFESRDGKTRFDSILNQTKQAYLKHSSRTHPVIYNGYPELHQLLNSENYQKAGLFLHALRLKVGDPAFFKSMAKYYSKFKNKNARTSDFRWIVESVSRQKLKPFFTLWLENPGLPEK